MQSHRLNPEAALIQKQWEAVNRHAWRLRRISGGALKLALLISVEEGLRDEVEKRVQFIRNKHQTKGE